jgi:hypothetical protein
MAVECDAHPRCEELLTKLISFLLRDLGVQLRERADDTGILFIISMMNEEIDSLVVELVIGVDVLLGERSVLELVHQLLDLLVVCAVLVSLLLEAMLIQSFVNAEKSRIISGRISKEGEQYTRTWLLPSQSARRR